MSIDIQPEPQVAKPRPTGIPALASRPEQGPSRPGTWWKRGVVIGVVLVVLGAAAFLLLRTLPLSDDVDMLTYTVNRGDLVVSVTEEGTLESSSNKEIKCRVKGGSTVLWVIESGTEVQPGDELVRLDQSTIEDNISQQKIAYETALANKATSANDVAVAKISITEYQDGTYRSDVGLIQKDLVIAESNLKSSMNSRDHAQRMFRKGYISRLELDAQEDSVKHAQLEVELKKTDLDVLEKFTKAKTIQEKESLLQIAEATLAANEAAFELEEARLRRAELQLENCVIRAETAGMVIYPSAAEWKREPDIEEGAAVREDQVLLIMPDLDTMQVKVGIHEAKVDRVQPGTKARIQLQDTDIEGRVSTVASIAKPAGWWTGNVVKYDTIIDVDPLPGLKPGMSATVELVLAEHQNVLTIPVAAVVEEAEGFCCWVMNGPTAQRRSLELGDSNDQFIVVESGLKEGDQVVLNPLAYIDEAQAEALKPIGSSKSREAQPGEPGADSPPGTEAGKRAGADPAKAAVGDKKAKQATDKPRIDGAAILKAADKNSDGVLTKDEFAEKDRANFDKTDRNQDGKVDVSELNAALKKLGEDKK